MVTADVTKVALDRADEARVLGVNIEVADGGSSGNGGGGRGQVKRARSRAKGQVGAEAGGSNEGAGAHRTQARSEQEANASVGDVNGVVKALGDSDGVEQGFGDNEVIVHLAIAGGPVRRDDGATDEFKPTSAGKLAGGEVPVSSNDPRAVDPNELGGNGVQQVEVGLAVGPDQAVEVGGANVQATTAASADMLEPEPVLSRNARRGGGISHADVRTSGDGNPGG